MVDSIFYIAEGFDYDNDNDNFKKQVIVKEDFSDESLVIELDLSPAFTAAKDLGERMKGCH